MKTKYLSIILIAIIAITGCNTDIENIGYVEEHEKSFESFEAIRAYKATDHEYIFGWFGGWNGGGASMASSLKSLPDSMDMVSIWGGWDNLSDLQKADMKYVQEVKGTKVLACIFTPTIGKFITPEGEDPKEYWGWDNSDANKQEEAIRKYSKVLVEVIIELGYDGIDMDNEPESDNVYGNERLTSAFIEVVAEYMGPASGTGRIFCVDGSLTTGIRKECDQYINYYIAQAYDTGGATSLDYGVTALVTKYGGTRKEMARKYIPTCGFELNAPTGGGSFFDRDRVTTNKAEGFAAWKPLDTDGEPIMKGGAGMYHIENDYKHVTVDYYYTRRMIQLMNPPK